MPNNKNKFTISRKTKGKNHLAESQKDYSTYTDKTNLFDHGLTLVSHCFPLETSHEEVDRKGTFEGSLTCCAIHDWS